MPLATAVMPSGSTVSANRLASSVVEVLATSRLQVSMTSNLVLGPRNAAQNGAGEGARSGAGCEVIGSVAEATGTGSVTFPNDGRRRRCTPAAWG